MSTFRPRLSEGRAEWEMIIEEIRKQGLEETRKQLGITELPVEEQPPVQHHQEREDLNWREMVEPVETMQDLFKRGKTSFNISNFKIDTDQPILVVLLADFHIGSYATDYALFKQITEEIINTPNLYVIMAGDMIQMAIKLRGVKEVMDNALPPEWQMKFLDSWLQDISHKVILSTWDNHSVMREENVTGFSMYADIFSRHTTYSNGIAHADISIGEQVYKLAVSHFFLGRSMYNPCHGQMRYMREQAQDRDICLAGDSHVPGLLSFWQSGRQKVALNCGTLQTNSSYAKRFFSLTTAPVFPCVELFPNEKRMIPYWSVSDWMNTRRN